MLPKKYRLKDTRAFKFTYKLKHSIHKGGITLFVGAKKTDEFPTKVGFVVSKKAHKRAVKRNHLKRLMREAYRLLLKEKKLGNSQKYKTMIFIGTENAISQKFSSVQKHISNLLGQL